MSSSLVPSKRPARGLRAPSLTTTAVKPRSARPRQAPIACQAMISRSSGCAPMPRCVVRASAACSGPPSGTITLAAAWLSFMRPRTLSVGLVAEQRAAGLGRVLVLDHAQVQLGGLVARLEGEHLLPLADRLVL